MTKKELIEKLSDVPNDADIDVLYSNDKGVYGGSLDDIKILESTNEKTLVGLFHYEEHYDDIV